jgi:hypothetical protein
MTGMYHHTQPLVEMRYLCFFPGWHQTVTLLISNSQLARITGLSHCPVNIIFFFRFSLSHQDVAVKSAFNLALVISPTFWINTTWTNILRKNIWGNSSFDQQESWSKRTNMYAIRLRFSTSTRHDSGLGR